MVEFIGVLRFDWDNVFESKLVSIRIVRLNFVKRLVAQKNKIDSKPRCYLSENEFSR